MNINPAVLGAALAQDPHVTLEQAKERPHRQFFGITDNGEVKEVTGYDCGPSYKGEVWWVPELGYSMSLGAHIFTDKESALKRAIEDQEQTLKKATDRLAKLRKQLETI